MIIPICLVVIACLAGWVYGEVSNNRSIRILSSIASVVVLSAVAAVASGLYTALSVGIPMSTAVREYLDASRAQLSDGNTHFVIDEFEGFKRRASVTYETGAFLGAIERETQRMHDGPSAREGAQNGD
ncbi:MAG: hypothetical protein CMJ48_06385 [Planctomycetaceae bacterium]|nr:hypothetical protein [Planctomycetaceae bacterium]